MNASFTEQFFQSKESLRIFYHYRPSAQASHLFVLLHGFAEHSGRYRALLDWLSAQEPRLSLLAFDLRGHGQSSGARAHVEDFGDFWRDTVALVRHIQETHTAPRRLIFCGHSMGGLIALQGLLKGGGPDAEGLILSSPCLGLPLNPFLKVLSAGMGSLFPHFYYAKPVHPENLTSDFTEARRYAQDPLIQKKISAGLLYQMLLAARQLEMGMPQLNVPAFFLLAGDERIVDLRRSLDFYTRLQAPIKRLRCFDGFRHEIFNEVHRQIAYDTVLDLVQKILFS